MSIQNNACPVLASSCELWTRMGSVQAKCEARFLCALCTARSFHTLCCSESRAWWHDQNSQHFSELHQFRGICGIYLFIFFPCMIGCSTHFPLIERAFAAFWLRIAYLMVMTTVFSRGTMKERCIACIIQSNSYPRLLRPCAISQKGISE